MSAWADYYVNYIANQDSPIHKLRRTQERIVQMATGEREVFGDGAVRSWKNANPYNLAGYVLRLAEEKRDSSQGLFSVMRRTGGHIRKIHQSRNHRGAVFRPLDNPRLTSDEFHEWLFHEAVRDKFGRDLDSALGLPVGNKVEIDMNL